MVHILDLWTHCVDESTDRWRQELRHDIRDAILADLRSTRLERFAR